MRPPDGDHHLPRAVVRYAAAWWLAGAVALAAMVLLAPPRTEALVDVTGMSSVLAGMAGVLVFVLLTAASEALEVRILQGQSWQGITLIESAVVAILLTFPAGWAYVVVLAGLFLALLYRRLDAFKVVFNLAQFSVAIALALGTYAVLRGGSSALSLRSLAAVLVAVLPFGMVNWFAVLGIVARLEHVPVRTVSRDAQRMSGSNLFGNAAAGMIGAVLWSVQPWLLVLVVAPLVTLHLAYRGVTRISSLLKRVEEDRDRLDLVITGASDGILLLDQAGVIQVFSPALETLTGISGDDAIGRPADEVLSRVRVEDEVFAPLTLLAAAAPEDPEVVVDATMPHRDGSERVVRSSLRALFDDARHLAGAVVVVHDVTQQREVARLKDDFIMRVSHELRTPLTPIKGYAESLALNLDKASPETMRMALGRISNRADHMVRLIDDLLLVSSVNTGRLADLRREPLDVTARVRQLVALVASEEPERELRMSTNGQADVRVDVPRFDRVLRVLLSNALIYSEPDQPIDVVVRQEETDVVISVTDQGRGIPARDLQQIFDRFHRVEDPMTMSTTGLGVGLYIARHLAQAMDGDIEVASRLGEGSTFSFRLPLATGVSSPVPDDVESGV